MNSRRKFLKYTGTSLLALQTGVAKELFAAPAAKIELHAHLWVYASRYPPNWDCTPILNEVFEEIKYAGFDGLEIMEPILRHNDAVERLLELQKKYSLPLAGTSYHGDMWNKDEHNKILDDIEIVAKRLNMAGGKMIGISVGDAGRKKTEKELDAQAELLKKYIAVCKKNNIEPNMHNHTYEMEYGMFDFKGTIARVPELKLGPDLNWLVRADVDPVEFIKQYGDKMVYMHIRDQYANGKWTEAVGEGAMDFKAIAKALKDINYNKKAAVELAFESDPKPVRPVKESWKTSRQFVQKVFGW